MGKPVGAKGEYRNSQLVFPVFSILWLCPVQRGGGKRRGKTKNHGTEDSLPVPGKFCFVTSLVFPSLSR